MDNEKNEFDFDGDENQFGSEENATPDSGEKVVIELPHTVTLEDPFVLGTKDYKEFVFQNRLEVEMLQHFSLGEKGVQKIGHFIVPIAKMTGLPTAAVKKLSWRDFDRCMGVVLNFFQDGQTTGLY